MSAQIESEILEHLKCLPVTEQLKVVESLARQLREDVQLYAGQGAQDTGEKLARAAIALREDYLGDKELTAFSALDREPFVNLRFAGAARGYILKL
jgi:hypothetical protein